VLCSSGAKKLAVGAS